ncbi:MAG: hypothetical protein COB85_04900 [Bacteroidetes bacterium]|nr:MAG: hypothetical protein COB85_04900 [Bacteroidota bacterium]
MRSMQDWLDAYGESHQNPTNKAVHWICVPAIFISVVGLIWSIPFPFVKLDLIGLPINWAMMALVLVFIYYISLSFRLAVGMLVWGVFCLWICGIMETAIPLPLWATSLIIFTVAWIGQFWGHKIEGKKPSLFEDIQFLMIGPAWLMHFIYKKLGIGY